MNKTSSPSSYVFAKRHVNGGAGDLPGLINAIREHYLKLPPEAQKAFGKQVIALSIGRKNVSGTRTPRPEN